MPRRYPTPQPVRLAVLASEIHLVGINVRIPRTGPATVSYYYEAVDDAKGTVESRSYTEPVTGPVNALLAVLRNRGNDKMEDAGYPTGGVTT